MKFETDYPKTVALLGVIIAAVLVVVGATVAPGASGFLDLLAGAALGAVGIQVGQKS